MAEIVYILCAVTSILCAALLVRNYVKTRASLLLWSSLCFVGLAVNNVLLFVDRVILPTSVDLSPIRNLVAIAALMLLLYGLIWEAET